MAFPSIRLTILTIGSIYSFFSNLLKIANAQKRLVLSAQTWGIHNGFAYCMARLDMTGVLGHHIIIPQQENYVEIYYGSSSTII